MIITSAVSVSFDNPPVYDDTIFILAGIFTVQDPESEF